MPEQQGPLLQVLLMPNPRLDVHITLRVDQGIRPDPPDLPRRNLHLLDRLWLTHLRTRHCRICINGSLSLQLILKMKGGRTHHQVHQSPYQLLTIIPDNYFTPPPPAILVQGIRQSGSCVPWL